MRADICEPEDSAAIERFRAALRRLGAVRQEKDWVMGCEIYRMKIGDDELTIYCDEWSLDIDGPDDLVRRVLSEYGQTTA